MLEDMFTRIENAKATFISDIVSQFGFTQEQAQKILTVFIKAKAVKLDPVMGRYKLTHGAFWEREVMENALKM